MDAETKRAIQSLTRELQRTQAELARVKRGGRRPQLGSSSIDSGALEVRDPETGATRLRLGYQPDGSVGVVPEGGDPPPAPTTPQVEPIGSGLSVRWDGQLAGGEALPGDFDHVNVYVSPESGFTPTGGSFAGTIHRDGGALPVAPLEVGTRYYARLVGVGTGGVQGPPSEQSSGVPESVTDIEPGSITETEIADDAITTPKIRAEAVQALHIAAEQIQAGHIEAAAITAAKLEADLVLGTRIIAGNPGGARVELDENGLRGYTGEDELAFVVDDQGNAAFSGNITGSEITGSRMTIAAPGGANGIIEGTAGGIVRSRVDATNGARAQIQGSPEQSELSVWSDITDPNSPAGGVLAQPGAAALSLYSDPSLVGSTPVVQLSAIPGASEGVWAAGNGSEVRIFAFPDWSAMAAIPPDSTTGEPQAGAGYVYAFRRGSTDAPTLSLQSPLVHEGSGAGRRSIIHVEGATNDRAYTVINNAARTFFFQGELVGDSTDQETDGQVQIADTHTIYAPRHWPLRTYMNTEPGWGTRGEYVDFTEAQMAPIEFRTSWSGWTRFTITGSGFHNFSTTTNVRIAFRLSGQETYPASPQRLWYATNNGVGSTGRIHSSRVVYMNLEGNADYVLTPQWYATAGGNASNVNLWESLENSIIVECLT